MKQSPISRRALLALLHGWLFVLLCAFILPSWTGDLIGGKADLSVAPAFVGSLNIEIPERSWAWQIPLLLPLDFSAYLEKPQVFGWTINDFVSPLLWFMAPTLLFGLLYFPLIRKYWNGRLVDFLLALAFIAFLGAIGPLALEPRPNNESSAAALAIYKDYQVTTPAVRRYEVPGQALVTPGSRFYGGSVRCTRGRCKMYTLQKSPAPPK